MTGAAPASAPILSTPRRRGRQKGETYKRGPRKPVSPTSRLISPRRTEQEYGGSYSMWRKLHHEGRIDVVKIGKAWFFKRADVEAFIQRNTERAIA